MRRAGRFIGCVVMAMLCLYVAFEVLDEDGSARAQSDWANITFAAADTDESPDDAESPGAGPCDDSLRSMPANIFAGSVRPRARVAVPMIRQKRPLQLSLDPSSSADPH